MEIYDMRKTNTTFSSTYRLSHMWCDHILEGVQCNCAVCNQRNCACDTESVYTLRRTHSSCHYVGTKTPVQSKKIHFMLVPPGCILGGIKFSRIRMCRPYEILKSLCTSSSSIKLFPHLRLPFRTVPGMYSYFRIGGGPSMEKS